ncbi:MAG: nucleotidyltransferase domain-containing protein [Saprospiraceae bacterium]
MITAGQIDEIVKILAEQCHPEKIILFGSHARGGAREDSDLDLAIVKSSDLPPHKRSQEFRKALRSGGRRWYFGMDILVFTPEEIRELEKNPASLVYEIMKNGKTLYAS